MKETIVEILQKATDYLSNKNIENPRLNAELLLSHALSIRRLDLYLQHSRLLEEHELDKFREYIKRRVKHEPIQYIIGQVDFYSVKLKVTPAVLIPRPETEVLVDAVLNNICTNKLNPYTIVDVGTGSGAIALSLADNLPNSTIYAIDISEEALKVAQQNCDDNLLDDRVIFLHGNLLEPLSKLNLEKKIDIIVSNPPYIPEEDWKELAPEVKNYEPSKALFCRDGVSNHLKIIQQGLNYLIPNEGFMIFECGLGQANFIASQLEPLFSHQIFKDYSDRERILLIHNS